MNTQANTVDGEEWLERALQESGREHRAEYIADDGFTSRVIARLPEPVALPAWRRPAVALLWLMAGAATVITLPGLFDDVFRGAVGLLVGHRFGLADVVMAVAVLAGLTCSALVYAARTE